MTDSVPTYSPPVTGDVPVDDHTQDLQHHGPTDRKLVHLAILLAGITAVEVAWSYLPIWEDASGLTSFFEIAGLLIMMMWKFVIVAGTFMHLKFDSRLLTRVFYAGFALAVVVYVVTLATFELFSSSTPGFVP
jgi:cytochrome c oxidase subunit IV